MKPATTKDLNCAIGKTILQVWLINFKFKIEIPGQKCHAPDSLPKGKWSCEENELPIPGTSFLDEGAQTYSGELLMYSAQVDIY